MKQKKKILPQRKVPSFFYLSTGYSFSETQSKSDNTLTISQSIPLALYWYYSTRDSSTRHCQKRSMMRYATPAAWLVRTQ